MTDSANSRVRAVSKFFFEGDRKFFIKGATYGPLKPDANGNTFGRPEQVDVDLRMMREIGINTDRKSTRLNSSHSQISYAVFCLKKKKRKNKYPSCHLAIWSS